MPRKPPLPERAKIGPFTYRIAFDNSEFELSGQSSDKLYGFTDNVRGVVVVDENAAPSMKRVTLVHELLHATAFVAGQIHTKKRSEEEWVVMVAPMLLDALQRSPEVVKYLLSTEGE